MVYMVMNLMLSDMRAGSVLAVARVVFTSAMARVVLTPALAHVDITPVPLVITCILVLDFESTSLALSWSSRRGFQTVGRKVVTLELH